MPQAPFKRVTAKRGKHTRAEPVAALYEQGRVHHCGPFPELEEQLTTWTTDSKDSPDRLDALVWGLVELGLTRYSGGREFIEDMASACPTCEQLNKRGSLRCQRCNNELPVEEPEPEFEPEVAEDYMPDPVPFGLVSGRDVTANSVDPKQQAVMDAIQQFGPQQWTPFGGRSNRWR